MIAKAIDKLMEISRPYTIAKDGNTWVSKKMMLLDDEWRASPLEVKTLTAVIDYIRKCQNEFKDLDYILHVASYKEVRLLSSLDSKRSRETLMVAKAETQDIPFGTFLGNERMLITMMSMFRDNPETDKAAVMKFAGTVTNGTIKDYSDDGISQKATIRQGVASKVEAIVPSPCMLQPYRTFTEIEQPVSAFIFRMRDRGEPESALYEADGGAWKNEAVHRIHVFLDGQLGDTGILIIS